MSQRQIVLSTPLRTAIGTFGGSLKGTPATSLGAAAISAVLARAKLDAAKIDTVVMGNVVQAGNKMNPARQAAIQGGLPVNLHAWGHLAKALGCQKPRALTAPRPKRVVFLVQQEVAARLAAGPGTGDYGALSAGVQLVATVERLFGVKRGAFRPAPRVDSALVRITPREI